MIIRYPFCRVLFFSIGVIFAASVACDTLLFLILAFICESESGDLIRPVISALHFVVIVWTTEQGAFFRIYRKIRKNSPRTQSSWGYVTGKKR
jgi:hypothetical protein